MRRAARPKPEAYGPATPGSTGSPCFPLPWGREGGCTPTPAASTQVTRLGPGHLRGPFPAHLSLASAGCR